MKGSSIWLWPCGIKEEFVLLLYYFIDYTSICVFGIFLCVSSVSSPYLLVFGDDRVRGTREQVMMQVELVRLNCGEGMIMGLYYYVLLILDFEMICKLLRDT